MFCHQHINTTLLTKLHAERQNCCWIRTATKNKVKHVLFECSDYRLHPTCWLTHPPPAESRFCEERMNSLARLQLCRPTVLRRIVEIYLFSFAQDNHNHEPDSLILCVSDRMGNNLRKFPFCSVEKETKWNLLANKEFYGLIQCGRRALLKSLQIICRDPEELQYSFL